MWSLRKPVPLLKEENINNETWYKGFGFDGTCGLNIVFRHRLYRILFLLDGV